MRPRSKRLRAPRLPSVLVLLAGPFSVLVGGCGSELGGVNPLDLATWIAGNGQPPGNGNDGAGGAGGSAGPGLLGLWSATPTVAGEVEVRDGVAFELSEQSLSFGEATALLTFYVINVGNEVLRYTVRSDVPWAEASPSGGTNAGGEDQIEVRVQRQGLGKGLYAGRITVAAEGGASEDVAISMTVGAGRLAVSTVTLDFGANAHTRGFTLWNEGGGTLAYTIDASVDWLTVTPNRGQISAEVDQIEVTIRRGPMVTGPHQAQLTVRADGSEPVRVDVKAEKSVTKPLIMPWMEVNYAPHSLELCVEGLKLYRRVTDTAIVSTTPGHAFLYTELRRQVPDMRIIPGMKTCLRLDPNAFDSPAGWKLIAQDVREVLATSGARTIIMENEDAIKSYIEGVYQIDFERLRQCFQYLPKDAEYIWYPVHMHSELVRARTIPIIHALQDVLDVRLVDHSYGHPDWCNEDARRILEELAVKPVIPMLWWGCFTQINWCYWSYDRVAEAMQRHAHRDDVIFYPSHLNWVILAQAVVNTLSP